MGERPKGPLPEDWRPPTDWETRLLADILQRLAQHSREDTLPRSPRGLFYDLRPNGMGNGLTYVKRPEMFCIRGEHVMASEGYCQVHRSASGGPGPVRRVDERQISPAQVQGTLVLARRAGHVPEEWIEDTRAPDPASRYFSDQTAEQRAEQLLRSIRNPLITWNPQTGQPYHVEVLVEAAGLIGRLARVAGDYGVPVYSGAGFDGLKGKRALAERASGRDVPTVVLRVTDWDEHGRVMADSSFRDSHAWSVSYYDSPGDLLQVERIALTEIQAADAGLLDADGKAEADALPVPVMDQILREAIEAYQDPDISEANAERGREESGRVTGLVLEALNGSSS